MTFDEFLRELANSQGLVWRKYRHQPAPRRVEERLRELGLRDFKAYLDYLQDHPQELAELPDRMHITVTRFFRDRGCWKQLEMTVLPALIEESPEETIRAWSAGCCGGEEPFTLAMVWLTLPSSLTARKTLTIRASDIDGVSLERAREGCFEKGSLREVPPAALERFFRKEKNRWCVKDGVRELVSFERRNIFTGALPTGMDLVLCRYIPFTYFQGSRLAAAAERLAEALRPGGLLMVGEKEEIPPAARGCFAPVPGCPCFYRRK